MNFDLIRKRMINNRFSLSYRNGEKLYEDRRAEIIDIKEIKNINYIYGRVREDRKVFSTFIKADSNGTLLKISCNCEINEEARKSGSNFACSHLIATVLELTKKSKIYESKSKDEVELSILLEDSFTDDYLYNISLYLKDKSRIRINSKKNLEYNILSEKAVYSFKRINYSKVDKSLIKKIHDLNFKIKEEDLREFLFLCRYKKIQAKINSMEYNTRINLGELPLKFTLKMEGNKIKLQRRKDEIIALNKQNTVYLFNGEIYCPPFKQCKSFSVIYSILKEKYCTYVNKGSLKKVIKILLSIGQLNIHDEVKNILAENMEIDLYFFMEDEKIYCKFLNKENYLKSSLRIKNIEENLFVHGFTKNEDRYYFTREDKDLFKLLKSDLSHMCNIKSSKELGNLNIISSNELKGKIEKRDNKLFFDINFKGDNSEIFKAVESFRNREEFYKFKNFSFLDFSNKDIKECMNFFDFIDYRGESILIKEGYEELFYTESKKNNFIKFIESDTGIKEEIESPKDLKGELRKYQLEGLRWLQGKKENKLFGILADEMGLGKTIQIISFLLFNKGDLSMIIVPTSLVYNWINEFKKFAPKLKICCVNGDKSKREKLLENALEYDVIITSYGLFNMDVNLYEKIEINNLILDEGQTIKNSKAKITMNVKRIKAQCRFVLTGTPIENNLFELWSIFDFLKPGYLFSEGEFKRKFSKLEGDEVKYLRILIKPFILRRTKKEVLKDLPEKNQKIIYVSMTDKQKTMYKNSINIFKKEAINLNNSISILALLTKLREIALDPRLIDEDYDGDSSKVEETLKIIKDSVKDKKKTLIFSQFTGMLSILKENLDKLKIEYYYLDGSTKASKRVELCNEFNKRKKVKVFLISLKAGGTGLNLTSAERVIHFDPWWNPAVENQATDRAHRIGQKNEVEVIKIITKGTIEEKILKLKEEKNKMISELLCDEDNTGLRKSMLTKEEINYLLSYDEI